MLLLTHHDPRRLQDRAQQGMDLLCQSARRWGHQVRGIPADWSGYGPYDVIGDIQPGESVVLGGYVCTDEYYETLAMAVAESGGRMIQPAYTRACYTHARGWYGFLHERTAKSVVIDYPNEGRGATNLDIDRVQERLNYPLFVKGSVKSRKEQGWSACVADNREELAALFDDYARLHARHVFVREVRPYMRSGETRLGFPLSREYRLYLYGDHILGMGPYWDSSDVFGALSTADTHAINELAQWTSSQLPSGTLALDVAQLEDGSWEIVEIGDWQYSSIMHVSHDVFWPALADAVAISQDN